MTQIFSVANQKGGVGKTTTAINLGAALAASGRSVLLLDLDPQGNASTGLGIAADDRDQTTYELLRGEAALDAITRPTIVPGLEIAPAVVDLSGLDIELSSNDDRLSRLKAVLMPSLTEQYEIILIDCPPSLNLLTVNAMVASDAVLVPLQCEFFALEGLSQLMETIERVRSNINHALHVQGVVLTMYDRRNNLSVQVEDDVRNALGSTVYDTVIPRNVRLSEAPSHGLPAMIYDHLCSGSRAYQELAAELTTRAGLKPVKERSFNV